MQSKNAFNKAGFENFNFKNQSLSDKPLLFSKNELIIAKKPLF
jgi:hypothetical protein